ncbi:transglutaminase family protein [Limnohabitans sp. 63ED37-2]|uniref:transglutaminase family protein n=1 Tax=Limnohabitans sp. 63ED37-2 TaxID=1678128 RepID=UPI000705A98A|nr:transglutaminase family protein [Limnohabitans sp. 63ED37-2]ALK88641.1 Transglutaminase-like superfamily protein [Limnohabitans sp. 63ED37-2]
MSIQVALHHVTHYTYDRPVQLGPQVIRLRPAPHSRSRSLSYSLKVEPSEHFINWQQDTFANYQARLVFPKKTTAFKVTVDVVTEMAVFNPFDFFLEPTAEEVPFKYADTVREELQSYLVKDHKTPLFKKYLASLDRKRQRTIDFLVQVNQRLHQDIRYTIRMEPGVQTAEETLTLKSGSCRDTAWLLVQLFRHMNIAARFVSGYLIQLAPDVKSLDGPSGTEVDFTDLHAWCEVYLPGAGWIGLDPTSGLLAGEGHIPLACTPQPSAAAPIEGLMDEAEVEFHHEMSVTRIHESPRVTKPYTEDQWTDVLALGDQVDAKLLAQDVRLTMGGEPTFVSTQDRDGAEWNTDALGPTKRGLATELVHKLRQQYGQGGFLHFGQGKWYPGEQLPRWALSIYWRADGTPCWQNPAVFADEREPSQYTSADAQRFMHEMSQQLGLPTDTVLPGYEDTWYYLWRERRLPVNVDPFDAKLDDEMERNRLRRIFSQGLDHPVGYVLPLQAVDTGNPAVSAWETGRWFLREERMYLMPGDSPMGWRLPLDSLPWSAPTDRLHMIEQDPFSPRGPLPTTPTLFQKRPLGMPAHANASASSRSAALPAQPVSRFESDPSVVRTALCVEVRDPTRANGPKAEAAEDKKGNKSGVLYVFMPPLARLEDYLALVSAVETTALKLDMKVVMEGYPPPRDPRLKLLQVTPDPGVIEVNIHPAHNWTELVQHTEFLYQAAFETRLSAEKFMTDGRHTGTGGGNHMVMGGATPADSPFLRRPELLASLVLYWHNHPSLSYLFSGMFIGPTSQAPRVDEARNDQVYELEIALREIVRHCQKHGQDMPPWTVDRTLRNILIDVTGNTHRSEFCIDKMYSPDSSTGRLGLLELRAFEMPPHARMSIVQQLLLRALVARFWDAPYSAPVTRWGTELHDRFMLPHWIHKDFDDVLTELGDAGFHFDPSWFAPHFEFRFPVVGQVQIDGAVLTLRNALEPWHVMGEESGAGGTARYVDSSLERIEVHVTGMNPSRHTVTVNGTPLPLQPTGVVGEYVASVRYKAWNPPSSLHPSIGVHAPLTVDLVDTWMKRSLGGCQYHVVHPGGRNYDGFPVNAYEAESRRMARFFRMGHTPGAMKHLPTLLPNAQLHASPEFPHTLDLRRQSLNE